MKNMITISEHTIEELFINNNGWVLDLGCINFTFATEIKKYCNNVICVDPNSNINEIPKDILFENKAIINGDDKQIVFYEYNDIQGYSILNPKQDCCFLEKTIMVESCNIHDLMIKYNIKQFDLIKFDIEGAEYSILENFDWTISKQYSIEFHDFRYMNPYFPNNEIFYTNLKKKMKNYCDIIKHEITDHPGFPQGLGRNYWDSLFILKREYWL
jgi:FkbM family methyltransferase